MVRGFKAQANRIAVEIRDALDLCAWAPLDPLAVCQEFEIEVIPLSAYGALVSHFMGAGRSAFSAVTVPCGLRRAIVHNDSHHPYRQRSNIMHELAHGFLGHPPCSTFDCDGERVYDGGVEAEASFLAGCLLITNEAAWHIVRSGLTDVARGMYGVSKKMLDYRLRVSGAAKRASFRQTASA
jgi:Zn-dependent peptidase ImmA (M78 family)